MFPTRLSTTLDANSGPIHCGLFSRDGKYCLTAGSDRCIRLWNPQTKTLIKTYTGHGKEVLSVQLPLNDNTRFVSCGGDRQVFLWDVSTGKVVQKFQGHTLRVNSVDFNKDATVIVSGSYDSTIRLWDCRVTTKKCIQILEDAKDSVETVSIVDYEIITGSVDGHTRIYDIRTGTVIVDNIQSMIILTTEPVTAVKLSNDKNCLLSCSLDSIIRLLDKDTGELLCDYKGHVNKEYRMIPCFTKTDSHVIGGSEDGKIYIWDLVEGKVVKCLEEHKGVVTGVVYHPDIHAMLTTSFDGTAKLWVY